jgi:hypothetical protein
MKRIVIALITLSICFGGGKLPTQIKALKEKLQNKYQVYSLEDISKLKKQPTTQHERTASRDMGDLVGDWLEEEENVEYFITVGTDQSITNPLTLMAMAEAEGSVTFSLDFTDAGIYYDGVLTYILDPSFMDDDGGFDCDFSCEGEYDDYNDYGIEPSDIYCECCHDDWPLDDICEGGGRTLSLEFEGIADMNYARYGAGYATDGEFVYAISGADVNDWPNNGERYNPDTDTWEIFVEGLIPRRYTNAEYVNGNIYLINGYPDTTLIEVINVSTGDVSESQSNPYPVAYGGSAVWNDKIYVFGGGSDDYGYSNRLYEFDPAADSWTQLEDMPESKQTNGQVVDGILYVFGGYNGDVSSSIHAYDIEQNTWSTDLPDMPVGISAHSVATDGEMIAVIGDYSDIEFCGIYDPNDNQFFILDNNMEGRRHSASVYLDGSLYAYGGSQPDGFNGNIGYTVLSSAERGELIDDEDDDAGLIIMNMNLMEFFMVMFGADIDSLGIENPTAIALFGEDTVEYVEGVVFGDDTTMIELNTEDVAGAISIGENTVTFSNLNLQDSTGVNTMNLNGTIGPGSIDLVAGEETSLDFFNDLFEDDDEGEFYLSFNEDSTGMGVEIEYDDYYGEEYADTSNFDWIATADSLFLYFEGDYYYGDEADTIELAYAVHDVNDDGYFDSLFVNASFNPCEDDDYDSYDDCFEDMELFGLDELEDVESFRVYEELVFSSGGFTSVAPGDGTMPNEFNLYGNYPNPFNPVTSIRFDVGLKSGNNTSLLIYDITGRNVAILINEQLQNGTYEVKWDARGFASGIYFTELISGTNRHTQKMVLLK